MPVSVYLRKHHSRQCSSLQLRSSKYHHRRVPSLPTVLQLCTFLLSFRMWFFLLLLLLPLPQITTAFLHHKSFLPAPSSPTITNNFSFRMCFFFSFSFSSPSLRDHSFFSSSQILSSTSFSYNHKQVFSYTNNDFFPHHLLTKFSFPCVMLFSFVFESPSLSLSCFSLGGICSIITFSSHVCFFLRTGF